MTHLLVYVVDQYFITFEICVFTYMIITFYFCYTFDEINKLKTTCIKMSC